mgnify:CR=1 FL=1
MGVENILSKLPLTPGKEHLDHLMEVDDEAFDELYKDYCFYKRAEVITNENAFTDAFGFVEEPPKTGYGARCRCTACDGDFIAGYKNSSKGASNSGIILIQGDDGTLYDGYACEDDKDALIYRDNDFLECPLCGETIFAKRVSEIADECELYALRSQEIINVEGYTAVMTWEWRRWFTPEGYSDNITVPISSVIIDDDGNIRCFYWYDEEWCEEVETEFFDGHQQLYDDTGSINELKIGGICDPIVPDMTGKTGEKTGLEDFIRNEGNNPIVWLLSWKAHPNIEALIKSSYGKSLAYQFNDIVDQNISYDYFPTGAITDFEWIDFSERKPHKMLGISKDALKELGAFHWEIKTYSAFDRYFKEYGVFPLQFHQMVNDYGLTACNKLADLLSEAPKEINLDRIMFYLKKQNCNNHRGAELFIDYINMVGFEEKELFYPKNLEEAHDRAAETFKSNKYNSKTKSFKQVHQYYSELEYSDGELSVILPKLPSELIQEGKVLRHCVGSYVDKHAEGKSIIFFVRHSRRPERSYYTLNIEFGVAAPREVQLHGYGNERHGPNKQYEHKIPKKVRDFVDKWEKEVLMPWHKVQIRNKLKNRKSA